MNISQQILSDITIYNKYARFLPEQNRRETWTEIVDRNKNMHIKKFPFLKEEIEENYKYVYEKKVLPSMRFLQFSGKPIEINPSRGYNCTFLPINHIDAFSETMFLLLGGCGVGVSVQLHHIEELPIIIKPTKKRRYLIGDSIEGWADAVKVLVEAYFKGKSLPLFDFSDIRAKGEMLVTAGGRAPGAEPLKECLFHIQKILDRKNNGERLKSIEAFDLECYIADAVLSGGIRRAALITLISVEDIEMIEAKYGNWAELHPQRARSNNSIVIVRHKIEKAKFFELLKKIQVSHSGEPGVFFTNDKNTGMNPCGEVSLKPNQLCNLSEINGNAIENQDDFNQFAKTASFIATLQASYTNFHYLREIWKKNVEKDALIGVGITGCANEIFYDTLDLKQGAKIVLEENERVSKLLGINIASRTTTIKPSGSTSLVLGTSSGIHAWYAPYYIRRMQIGKDTPLYKYLLRMSPELLEDYILKPTTVAVLTVPVKAPEGAIFRDEPVLSLLERVKKFNLNWIKTGHRKGSNKNNVSCTVYVKPDEWDLVGNWMWDNKDTFNALSVYDYDDGTYEQCPFEEITEDKYEELFVKLKKIDLSQVKETEDSTTRQAEPACAGGACEII